VDKFDRIFQLHAILASRRTPISREELEAKLECSKATLLRAISTMKDYLGAPIEFDRDAGGYKYVGSRDAKASGGAAYELPGLWFTANELQALAIMRRLLKDAGGGLLEEHLGPLAKRLDDLTRHQRLNLGEAASRLRFPCPRSWTIAATASSCIWTVSICRAHGACAVSHLHCPRTTRGPWRCAAPRKRIWQRDWPVCRVATTRESIGSPPSQSSH